MESVSTPSAFDQASRAVVDYLTLTVPLGMWSVTRYDGERQVHLTLAGSHPGFAAGDTVPWTETLCQYSVSGAAPSIVADVRDHPVYGQTERVRGGDIVTYIGIPIRDSSGAVFGTLCGIDASAQHAVTEQAALFDVLTSLLGHVLDSDVQRAAAAREAAQAQARAETDALTGLLNRRGWDRMLAVFDERNRVFGDPVSLLVIDLDGLKNINDTAGHDAGDALLRRAAGVVSTAVRGDDVVARLGGDEFGVLVAVLPAEAVALADRLDRELAAAGVDASIGVAEVTVRAGCDGAWKSADENMYAVKATRRVTRRADGLVAAGDP